ncbi:MAG TPA: CAAX prenyl protease-related protein [Bryobacteraceae bacterium]|nr:CAAX prenyl protease-related protein [Bryobacteraceae bacterium]
MSSSTPLLRSPAAAYVAPFAVFVALMAVEHSFGLPPQWFYPVRIAATAAALLWFARSAEIHRPSSLLGSAAIGAAVFLIWIGPDVLFGPAYRHFWLFENSVTGAAASSAPEALKHNRTFIVIRTLGCAALVPVVEELFWRGWLMRWLVAREFQKVPLGTYAPMAFWGVAVMFASEHGPYWEVGLIAGIVYNWWMVRTRNLGDCIVAHAVTNALLSAYVLMTGAWQYWL